MKKSNIRSITTGALIAAMYVVLTLASNIFGLASGAVQFRLSEGLCVLAALTPAAIPGLAVGCFVANLLTGCALWDIIAGTAVTAAAASIAYALRRYPALTPLPNVILNTAVVPLVLTYVYGAKEAMGFLFLTVGIGEAVTSFVLGYAILWFVKENGGAMKLK